MMNPRKSFIVFIGAETTNGSRLVTVRNGEGDLLHSCYIDTPTASQLWNDIAARTATTSGKCLCAEDGR